MGIVRARKERERGGGGDSKLRKQREGSRDGEGEGKRSRDGGCETDRQTDRQNSTWTLEYSRTVALGAFRPNRESMRCYKLV